MNIMQKLTLRQLFLNKRRTLVTILGVIISVAMLSATASGIFSGLEFLRSSRALNEGEWHIRYENGLTAGKVSQIPKDGNTEIYVTAAMGFGKLPSPKNPRKPYVYVQSLDKSAFRHLPIQVLEGRLPENGHELVVTPSLQKAGGDALRVGDTVAYDLGTRVFRNSDDSQEYELSQYSSFRSDSSGGTERIINPTRRVYKVVGVVEEPEWAARYGPGALAFTGMEASALPKSHPVQASVIKARPSMAIFKEAEDTAEALQCSYSDNDVALATYLVIRDPQIAGALTSVCTALFGLIMVVGVSLIYNSFAISVTERSRQLGMLASVGATKKQKYNSILFEGLIVAAISIPLGIAAGIAGLWVTFRALNPVFEKALEDFSGASLHLVVNPAVIALSVVFSLLTIFISVYRPALSASRTTAIDALRQTKAVRIKPRQMKTPPLVRRLFGMEGDLALKNLKRNARRYRVTAVSLVMSVVLFLSVFGFSGYMQKMLDFTMINASSDVSMKISSRSGSDLGAGELNQLEQQIEDSGKYTDYWRERLVYLSARVPAEKATREFQNANAVFDGMCQFNIRLIILPPEKMREKMKAAGVTEQALLSAPGLPGILVNRGEVAQKAERTSLSYARCLNLQKGESIATSYYQETRRDDVSFQDLTAVGIIEEPLEYTAFYISEQAFDALEKEAQPPVEYTTYNFHTQDPEGLQEDLETIINENGINTSVNNTKSQAEKTEMTMTIIKVLTIGFITLMALICIANIINTLSTSIALRRKEFAMLKSVGITPKGFRKMIRFESLFYGTRALLWGLPISAFINYGLYKLIRKGVDFSFFLPWGAYLGAIAAVFLIVGVTMAYSMRKISKDSIIDTLKDENA